ncbi:ABC transporter substrate-binding protein [Nocardia sp. NPDC003963]
MTRETLRAERRWSRRRFLGFGAAAAGSAMLLAACGDGSGPGGDTTSAGSTDTFPVTVGDKFGEVTIESSPSTIASVGRTDHDVLLALGIVPATVYRFVPTMKRGVGVWAESRLGAAEPAILTNPINIEQVLAARPDLVLNVQSTGDEGEYRALSKIAPTVGLPPGTAPNTVTWQESTRMIATAVGRKADGERLIGDTTALLDRARNDNPAFHGKTVSILLGSSRQLGVFTVSDTRMKVATALGLVPSPYVAGLDPAKYFVDVSAELVNEADADIVIVLTREGLSRADTLAQYPALAASRAVRENRVVIVDDFDISLAFAAGSVLSIPFAVEGLVPLLKEQLT